MPDHPEIEDLRRLAAHHAAYTQPMELASDDLLALLDRLDGADTEQYRLSAAIRDARRALDDAQDEAQRYVDRAAYAQKRATSWSQRAHDAEARIDTALRRHLPLGDNDRVCHDCGHGHPCPTRRDLTRGNR